MDNSLKGGTMDYSLKEGLAATMTAIVLMLMIGLNAHAEETCKVYYEGCGSCVTPDGVEGSLRHNVDCSTSCDKVCSNQKNSALKEQIRQDSTSIPSSLEVAATSAAAGGNAFCTRLYAVGEYGKVGLRNNCGTCKVTVLNDINWVPGPSGGQASTTRHIRLEKDQQKLIERATVRTEIIGEEVCD